MAIIYINKSGSDANNGSTKELAKLTIQGAINASATNDTFIVGSGRYQESLTLSVTRNYRFDSEQW